MINWFNAPLFYSMGLVLILWWGASALQVDSNLKVEVIYSFASGESWEL